MKALKKFSVLFLAVCLVLSAVLSAFATGSIDTDRHISLTIHYTDAGTPFVGAEFSIYQVATVDEEGNLTTTERFSDYNVNITDGNDESWKALATTLEGYVLRDNLSPTDTQLTDEQGLASFPSEGVKLTPGFYLVLGTRLTIDEVIYETLPFMLLMPTQDPDAKEWKYDVTLSPKYELLSLHGHEKVTCKVLKAWNDKGYEAKRPDGVVMQLLCDGKVYDTVTLNEENNWRYIWSDLDATHQWRVVEQVPDGYTVQVSREGVTFLITNSREENNPPTEPSENPTKPVDPDKPSNPDSPDSTVKPATPDDPTLPQTSQLWWPVPILSAAGLLLIAIGFICLRGIRNEEN